MAIDSFTQQTLKRDEVPYYESKNWKDNYLKEQTQSLEVIIPDFYLEKSTYEILSVNNQNRIRVYLGLEEEKQEGKYVACLFAFSSYPTGDCLCGYIDLKKPVYKLTATNQDYSDNLDEVKTAIARWKSWRSGETDPESEYAMERQYIYPLAYLLTKYEMIELFVTQLYEKIKIDFGIEKLMKAMISAVSDANPTGVYDYTDPCPPMCDGGDE